MKKYVLMLLALALLPLGVHAKEQLSPKNITALAKAIESGDQNGNFDFRIRVIKNADNAADAFQAADQLFKDIIEQVMYEQTQADPHQATDLSLLVTTLKNARTLHTDLMKFLQSRHSSMQAVLESLEDFASNYTSVIQKVNESARQAGIDTDFTTLLREIINHTYKYDTEQASYSLSSIAGRVERHYNWDPHARHQPVGQVVPQWYENGKSFYEGLTATY